MLFQKTDEYR